VWIRAINRGDFKMPRTQKEAGSQEAMRLGSCDGEKRPGRWGVIMKDEGKT